MYHLLDTVYWRSAVQDSRALPGPDGMRGALRIRPPPQGAERVGRSKQKQAEFILQSSIFKLEIFNWRSQDDDGF